MATAFKRYLACLGIVCAVMAAYCATVVPLLEPPEHALSPQPVEADETKPNIWWKHLFAEDAWQNAKPMLLQTEQGTLLFRSLQQLGPNQWRLAPLTLIVPLSRDGRGAVVGDLNAASRVYQSSPLAIVVAPEGADIQFREAPDWISGSTPPLTGGLLRGPIQITGIDPRRGKAPQWSIKTANLLIDRRRVWTTSEVHIASQNAIAIGRDLSIHLKQDLLEASDEDQGPWGLLDHMELQYVKQVSVALPPGGLWKGMKLGSEATAAAHVQTPAAVELQCRGAFKFDFNQSLATLERQIRVEHRFQGEPIADTFLCQELKARFSVPGAAQSGAPAAITVGPMQLDTLEASGGESAGPMPSQSTVEIAAPNIQTELTAKRLFAQLDKRRFTLEAGNYIVELDYMGNIFRAPTVEYAAAPNDEHLGWLFASGPGEAESSDASEFGRATARWHKSLKMQPTETGELVTFEGPTLVEAGGRGHLASDHIDVSLMRLAQRASGSPAKADSPGGGFQYQVDRLDASGQVVMGNQGQNVHVGQMHIQFIYPDAGPAPETTAASPPPDASPPIGLPAATAGPTSGAGTSLPVLILGKELHSQVIVTKSQSWIDRLQISGPVVISRDGPAQPGDPDWNIEGAQLQLASNPAGQVDLQIVGQPARISFGSGYIEGPVIRMDQRTGMVWMDHPGEICVPGDLVAARAAGPGGAAAPNIEWLKPLKCRWQGHMLFNGSKANIEGDIAIDGCARTAPDRLLFIGGTCHMLEMLLTQPIDISKPGKTTATLQTLTLRRDVDIRTAQRDTSNRRLSLEEISVPELTYELATNRVIGSGPGWVRSQHLSNSGGMGVLASHSQEPRPAVLTQKPIALQGMHLKFRDTMEARLTERQLSFLGSVEVGIGPVRSLEEVINLDSMRTLEPEQILLSGDLLRVYDASDLSRSPSSSSMAEGAWEFEAMGHVAFEGKRDSGDFSGKAYRLTYAQAKDLIHVRGDARVPAELHYRPRASTSIESTRLNLWSGSLNIKTMRPTGDGADGQIELAPGSQIVPRGQAGAEAGSAPPPPPVRPRDAVNELFNRN